MHSACLLVLFVLAQDPQPENSQTKNTQTREAPNDPALPLLKTFRDEFIAITPGKGDFPKSFVMGSDDGDATQRPAHEVTFDYDFAIARYEVPQNLWEAVMGSNPSRWKGKRNSVEWLSFDEAVDFCQKVTAQLRGARLIGQEERIRLPTEAEWEYTARAGTRSVYSFGKDDRLLGDYAWFGGNAAGNDPPVGAKKPNPWGLHDVHGYLWEWCADVGHENFDRAPSDGSAWLTGGDARRRVIRGGSWKDAAPFLTSTCRHGAFRHVGADKREETIQFRGGVDKELRDDAIGLRCVLGK